MKLTPLLLALIWTASAAAALPNLKEARWRVRDIDNDSGKGLTIQQTAESGSFKASVHDETGSERAVTLAFCVSWDATGGIWCDDPQRSRKIDAEQVYSNCSDNAGGMNNEASLYPLSVVAAGDEALVLAVPPEPAAIVLAPSASAWRAAPISARPSTSITCAATPAAAHASITRLSVVAALATAVLRMTVSDTSA